MPQTGRGSQSSEYELHYVLAKQIVERYEKEKKAYYEENVEEEEWNPFAETFFSGSKDD